MFCFFFRRIAHVAPFIKFQIIFSLKCLLPFYKAFSLIVNESVVERIEDVSYEVKSSDEINTK